MESKSFSIRIPDDLRTAAEKRAREQKYKYFSDYILALIRFDLMKNRPHLVTPEIANASPEVQAAMDKGILEANASRGAKISYLEHLVMDTASVISQRIADALPEIIAENLGGRAISEGRLRAQIEKAARSAPIKPEDRSKLRRMSEGERK